MIAHGGFLWSRQRSCREHFCPHPSHQNTVTQLDHHKLTGKLSPSTCPRGRKNGFSEHMPGSVSILPSVQKYPFYFSFHMQNTLIHSQGKLYPTHSLQPVQSLTVHDDAKSFIYCVFYTLKVCGNPVSTKSVNTIFSIASLILCLRVTFWQFSHYFKLFHSYYISYGDL